MKFHHSKIFTSIVVWGLSLIAFYTPDSQADALPTIITLTDLDGKTITPIQSENSKACVVVFITTDCPIANALAPEINRIYEHYQPQGIQFTLVHVDSGLSVAKAKQHAREYSLKATVAIDRQQQVIRKSKALLTPQTAVFNHRGELVYTGRVNNQWVDYGKRRAKATEHNLRATLDALLAGKPAPKSYTTAIGCHIPDLE